MHIVKRESLGPIRKTGFTLVELAVVLAVVALLLGGLLFPLSAQMQQRNVVETEKTLNEIKEALIGFALVNRRLPRPAQSAANGAERGACANDSECSGFVPWESLGVKKTDAWNKIIRYSVSPKFAGDASGTAPIILASVANRSVRTRNSSAGADAPLVTGVPAILFSHGKLNYGTDNAGTTVQDGSLTNLDEDRNDNGSGTHLTYYSRLPSPETAGPGGEFDDIVTWISGNILFARMVAAGAIP